jgi:hypothetical protein
MDHSGSVSSSSNSNSNSSSSNANTLFECLVTWVNTFRFLDTKCENANDFKDGVLIAKCLNNM